MKQRRISKAQRDMLGRIITDPRGRMVDTLGLWAGPKAQTYRSLHHRGLVQERTRKSKVGLGRQIVWVKATKAGVVEYAASAPRGSTIVDLIIGMHNDSFGAGA